MRIDSTMIRSNVRMGIWIALLLALPVFGLSGCAGSGTSGGQFASEVEMVPVRGAVLLPDSTIATGATVWTDPSTEFAQTLDIGVFRFEQPIPAGDYYVYAELGQLRGSTLYRFSSGDREPLVIVLGSDRVSPRVDVGDLRIPPRIGPGRSRTGGDQ